MTDFLNDKSKERNLDNEPPGGACEGSFKILS